jgi:hypothetical protein
MKEYVVSKKRIYELNGKILKKIRINKNGITNIFTHHITAFKTFEHNDFILNKLLF